MMHGTSRSPAPPARRSGTPRPLPSVWESPSESLTRSNETSAEIDHLLSLERSRQPDPDEFHAALLAKLRASLLRVSLVLAIATAAIAQDPTDPLSASCDPVDIRIGIDDGIVDPDNSDDYGVTWVRIRTLAESRLRAARLYPDDISSVFINSVHIGVWYSRWAVFTEVQFRKWFHPYGTLTVWERRRLGSHRRDGTLVMQDVSEMVDEFILDYLRVNGEHCERRQ